MLTFERARELLVYDPETGVFTRKTGGAVSGTIYNGYVRLGIDGRNYRAHRVAWLVFHGRWPGALDHIDGDRANNRIANLREVTTTENNRNKKIGRNNTSGVLGVYKHRNRWRANIKAGGKLLTIGHFASFDEAVAARKAAERQYGFHENHGRAA